MSVKVRIPSPLRTFTNGAEIIQLDATSVADVLSQLSSRAQGIDKRLFKQPGELNRFINVYVNDEDIRFLNNLNTEVKQGDEISIVPAIAGG